MARFEHRVTASVLAFLLLACGDATEDVSRIDSGKIEEGPPLTAVQQFSLERFDRDHFRIKYRELREELNGPRDRDSGHSPTDNSTAGIELVFDELDRDENGRLSAPEFALWVISPNQDDNGMSDSELSNDQVEEIARNFFYYDIDGSLDLSEKEFAIAAGRGQLEQSF